MIETLAIMGQATPLRIAYGLMVYQVGHANRAYVTVHDVVEGRGAPVLGAGRPADLGFLRALSEALQDGVKPELLPDYVLCRTADTIVWWSEAQRRSLFFSPQASDGLSRLNAKVYAMPPLVWKIEGRHLYVRSLRDNARPRANTKLCHAPYWNTDASGRVCLGDMKRPTSVGLDTLRSWEDGYFGSQFTGQNGGGERVRGGLAKFWKARSARGAFPAAALVDAGETLEQFLVGKGAEV